ncbi:MAG: hypothetical protein P8H65_04445 [Rhodothermales bacterium]|nr:hypothetical protein [Rhodothermales bacterium]MDG2016850.1 hypothetical protein [Rhodothermales bacterium]HAY35478.1 hypothetical protein [Bacteroidota bacterium]
MGIPFKRLLRFLIVPVFGVLLLTGCEEEVNPFVEEDRFFTLFGYLDTASNNQYVRLMELRTEFADAGETSIDAIVTTTEIETGEVVAWRDSLITFGDGTSGHVFVGNFQPVPGWRYQLDVTRSDGKRATATTLVPELEVVDAREPEVGFAGVTQKIFWPQVDFIPFRVEVWYRTLDTSLPSLPFREAVVLYGDAHSRVGELENDGWEIIVRYAEDKEEVSKQLGVSEGAQPILMSMGMRLTMTDDSWRPPDGVFSEEILVQPGTFSNVEGGFGFFGSINQLSYEWTLDPSITSQAGYTYPGGKR